MKEWLHRNEIYFKTIAYILVPVIGIVVSIQANAIANRQTQIAEEQAIMLRQEKLPIINMEIELAYDNQISKYTDDILRILNDGTALRDLKIYDAVFF